MEKHFNTNTMDYNQAYERVRKLKSFYKSLTWYGIIAGILFFNEYFENGTIDFSFYHGSILLLIWGIILVIKGVKLFLFDASWEQRILDKELRKSKPNL
ncbi:2TM domain-containing protein [Chryseobacterium paridis]|uniref:2TM domain-containing protein n=1 Tax=Chryseobacterium paridis TaxID=2800328 RepID=A0ABS1FQL6_9FLAO|nr:2TM domain-containing protein [Chryseobacterium paridis]MBK1894731.1 2TM domain-containing protein [Chryseobacterium paridis]